MLAAVVATFFYLRIIIVMYMAPAEEQAVAARSPITIPLGAGVSLTAAVLFTLVVGFLPAAVFDFARHATLLRV
jgi:NADH:ubiquinone oxidoreductase subunit 2 (subunit N)